jgi:Divergent InlB B-repeat domain
MQTWTRALMFTVALFLFPGLALAQQTAGTWQEIAGSSYTASPIFCGNPGAAPAAPNCIPKFLPGGGNNIPQAAITAWVDGDYDPATGRFYIPNGGGHGDWAGNQVIAFNANTEKWEYLTPYSTTYTPMGQGHPDSAFLPVYGDGSPASVHSYGCRAWMPWLNKFWTSGGIYWSGPGKSTPKATFWWDPAGGFSLSAWTRKADRSWGGYGCTSIADPVTKRVLTRLKDNLIAYDPATDAYTNLFAQSVGQDSSTQSAMALADRKLYRISPSSTGSLRVTDLNNLSLKDVTLATTGDTQIQTMGAPGLIWDANRLIGFGPGTISGTGAIFTLDPAGCGGTGQPACVWTRLVPPDGIHPPRGSTAGIWRKFFRHKCDLYLIAGGGNVWRYRPLEQTDTCGAPPPTMATLTITKSGDGDGQVTGAGTYPLNTVVAISQTPDATSTATGFSGDAGCAEKSVPMSQSKTCVAGFAKVRYTLVLTSVGSTGAGTLSGGGSYVTGETATVRVLPNAGSAAGSVTGSPGCQVGPVVMDSNKTCNIPILDVQNPEVTISSPAENALIRVTTPLTYTVTDNMPGGTTTVLLDGQPFTAQDLDPSVLPEGTHQVAVLHVDAAGNSGQSVRNFITVQCPVCQPPSAAMLTVTKAGTGTGTVSGPSGAMQVGASVTLTPTAAAGSSYTGVSPAQCGQTFPMPPSDVTCVFTFTLIPPPTTYLLTITKAGTGNGTISGAGSYAPGTMVAVGGIPAPGSVDAGVAPPPCSATPFPMPAAALNCTKTYNLEGPPPVGLPFNTWVGTPQPTGQPYNIAGKHRRADCDPATDTCYVAGGDADGSDGGNPRVYALNLANFQGTLLSPMCRPAPELMPHFPDNVVWAWDTKRKQGVMMRGFMFDFPRGLQVCGRDGDPYLADNVTPNPAYDPNIRRDDMVFDLATKSWLAKSWPESPMGPGSDGAGPTWAIYDAPTDSVYMYKKDGAWGPNIMVLDRATNVWTRYKIGTSGQRVRNAHCTRSQPAHDPGKAIYMSCLSNGAFIFKFDLVTRTATDFPLPATYVAPGTDQETYMIFDPKNRVILHPLVPSLAGVLKELIICSVDAWSCTTIPAPNILPDRIMGNLAMYGTGCECLVFYGGHSTTLSDGTVIKLQPIFWRYRYKKP